MFLGKVCEIPSLTVGVLLAVRTLTVREGIPRQSLGLFGR